MFLKKYATWLLCAAIIVMIAISYLLMTGNTSMQKTSATIHGTSFSLHIAETEKQMETGLAAFDRIGDSEGMIFRGLAAGDQTIWMKGMKFDIDILWVDHSDRIIHIEHAVSKNSYPTVYRNPAGSTSSYVIELASGATTDHSITVGDTVTFR